MSWCSTLTIGARQLVVQEAFDRKTSLPVSSSSFTPMTIVASISSFAGAVRRTFFAPAVTCIWSFSRLVNTPVPSTTMSAPRSFHGSFEGSFSARTLICFPSTMMAPSAWETLPGYTPWTESYLNRYARVFASVISLMATTLNPPSWIMRRSTRRPILPNPFRPI